MFFLWKGLPETTCETLRASLGEERLYARGEVIYDGLHFEKSLGWILSGSARAEEDGVIKTSFGPGDVFGAAALFSAEEIYVSRIVAHTACRVLFVPERTVRQWMKEYPECLNNYLEFLSDRIRFLNRKIEQYTASEASLRLYRLLESLSDKSGKIESVPMTSLAGMSGLSRTSLYRALACLRREGKIEKTGKTILLTERRK